MTWSIGAILRFNEVSALPLSRRQEACLFLTLKSIRSRSPTGSVVSSTVSWDLSMLKPVETLSWGQVHATFSPNSRGLSTKTRIVRVAEMGPVSQWTCRAGVQHARDIPQTLVLRYRRKNARWVVLVVLVLFQLVWMGKGRCWSGPGTRPMTRRSSQNALP